MTIGSRIKQIRQEQNITQEQLADYRCRGKRDPELPCPDPQYPGGEIGFRCLQQKRRNV